MARTSLRTALVGLAFLVALTGMFAFGWRASRQVRRMRLENEPIRPWMSVPFIAHAHHVPAQTLFQAIGVEPRLPRDRRSVRRLSHDLHRPLPQIMAELQRAIDAQHERGSPPR